MKKRIITGDGTRGYDHGSVTAKANGKISLVPGSVVGRISIIRKCVANYNRGLSSYINGGNDIPFKVE